MAIRKRSHSDDISEIDRELHEAVKEVRRVTKDWKGTEAKGPRRMGAAKSDVAQRAASRTQSSKAEVGPLPCPGLTSGVWARWRTEIL